MSLFSLPRAGAVLCALSVSCVAIAVDPAFEEPAWFLHTDGSSFIEPNGTNYPWTRASSPSSTYAQWDIFTNPAGRNTPDIGQYIGGTLPPNSPAWDVVELSGTGIVTGSGNIYSFAAPPTFRVDVPSFDYGSAYATTVLVQIRVQGTELDANSVVIGNILPTESVELARVSLGGQGFMVDWLFRFELQGNAAGYEVGFGAVEAHMSLDNVAIDTFAFEDAVCYADCDSSGALNVFDYICFGSAYASGQPYADCDTNGVFNVFDYICFGNAYAAGCP